MPETAIILMIVAGFVIVDLLPVSLWYALIKGFTS
jgi:hypothetical protein